MFLNQARLILVGLKSTITEEGVWRIRKPDKVPRLELFKLEETGHGDILSANFVNWRTVGLPEALKAEKVVLEVEPNGNAPNILQPEDAPG